MMIALKARRGDMIELFNYGVSLLGCPHNRWHAMAVLLSNHFHSLVTLNLIKDKQLWGNVRQF